MVIFTFSATIGATEAISHPDKYATPIKRQFRARLSVLEEAHVAFTPGLSFGDEFDNYIRLAFTLDENVIREGID